MEKEYMTVIQHNEYAKRMEDEHRRQNKRISDLEETVKQNNKLLVSVEKLALCMKQMQEELKGQGERLEVLEDRDGEMWRKVTGYAITAIVGILIGFIFTQIGM